MIHEAYMPVYRCPDFSTDGFTRGSTRGPPGPKNNCLRKVFPQIFTQKVQLCLLPTLAFQEM